MGMRHKAGMGPRKPEYAERSDTNSLFAEAWGRGTHFYHPFTRAKRPSIDIKASTSIDIRSQPTSTGPEGYARAIDGHALQVSVEDIAEILQMANGADNIFMQQRNIPENQQRVATEFYTTAGDVDDCFKPKYRQHTRPSIDIGDPTSIDRRPEFGKRAYDCDGTRRFHWEEKDEYGVYRDDPGHARDVDGHIIRVSKDDVISLLQRASMDEHNYLCLPEDARSFTQTKLVPEIYTKDERNEMLFGEMRQDIASMQAHRAAKATTPASIDINIPTSINIDLRKSIDDDPTHSNPMKSQPNS
ncbi:hypothetical protein F2Q69_00036408 [Brassica cretica]|uniref:Uncharacterized protein n=1 Tax=Brassica cretica TaxID=69181 RepID=A0A8S9SIP7_BRACR|nr:hypothetical protein F2Q69_00036408 [Brassica cretica]